MFEGQPDRGKESRRGGFARCALSVALIAAVTASTAQAATFTNPTPIAIPAAGTANGGPGIANPYPSIISSTTEGRVTQARVTFNSFSHNDAPNDVDALLFKVGSNASTILISDSCGGGGNLLTGINLTFDDAAAATLQPGGGCVTGTYKPTNNVDGDPEGAFAAAAGAPTPPAPPYPVAMSALNGTDANGQWALYLADDDINDTGSLDGGWTLELLTDKKCSGKTATGITHLGTGAAETIVGTPGKDVLLGLGGKDTLKGLGGNDVICGGSGKDKVKGGPGKDKLFGQGGKDKLNGQGGKDTCKGGGGNDSGSCEKEKSL